MSKNFHFGMNKEKLLSTIKFVSSVIPSIFILVISYLLYKNKDNIKKVANKLIDDADKIVADADQITKDAAQITNDANGITVDANGITADVNGATAGGRVRIGFPGA